MKHVLVETNFLIELARPVPATRLKARTLYERCQRGEVALLVPWCSLTEAKRTLGNIIKDDFSFRKSLEEYAASRRIQAQVRSLLRQAQEESVIAQSQIEETIESLRPLLTIIEPTRAVVEQTMRLFPVKSLPPFDEMVLGAVLCRAEQLRAGGETDLWFCNLNKRDFGFSQADSTLAQAYHQVGMQYLDHFDVPR